MSGSTQIERASWYVLQTKPRQEFRALEQLEKQAYTCFLPTLNVEKRRRGKMGTFNEPLFARYLFIHLDLVTSNWSPIRSTRGVSCIVAFGSRFATLPEHYVEALQKAPAAMPDRAFVSGERVAITSGLLAGMEAIYQMPDGEARAMVLIELMCRTQKVAVPTDVLRKAA